jgi:antitoxin component YwqK of YwqJK toxin-antitoxin module
MFRLSSFPLLTAHCSPLTAHCPHHNLSPISALTDKKNVKSFLYSGLLGLFLIGYPLLVCGQVATYTGKDHIRYNVIPYTFTAEKNYLREPEKYFAKNDLPDGIYIGFYDNDTSKICYTGQIRNKKFEGLQKWYYDTDNLNYTAEYQDGKLNGKYTSYDKSIPNLKLVDAHCKNNKFDGPYKAWNYSGWIREEGQYEKGLKTGTWKTWYEKEKQQSLSSYGIIPYPNGNSWSVNTGEETRWFENGRISLKGSYKKELKNEDTLWTFYSYFPSGTWQDFWKNGNLRTETSYKDYVLDGFITNRDTTGKVISRRFFVYNAPADSNARYPDSHSTCYGFYAFHTNRQIPNPGYFTWYPDSIILDANSRLKISREVFTWHLVKDTLFMDSRYRIITLKNTDKLTHRKIASRMTAESYNDSNSHLVFIYKDRRLYPLTDNQNSMKTLENKEEFWLKRREE